MSTTVTTEQALDALKRLTSVGENAQKCGGMPFAYLEGFLSSLVKHGKLEPDIAVALVDGLERTTDDWGNPAAVDIGSDTPGGQS